MLIIVGSLTRHADGCLAGVLRTLTIRTQLELRPTAGGRYEVMIGSGFVAGYATSTATAIEITVLSLEFAAPVRIKAVPHTPEGDEWRLEWESGDQRSI